MILAVSDNSLIRASMLLDRSPTQADKAAELLVVNRPLIIAVLSSGVCLGSGGLGGPEGLAATFFFGGIVVCLDYSSKKIRGCRSTLRSTTITERFRSVKQRNNKDFFFLTINLTESQTLVHERRFF